MRRGWLALRRARSSRVVALIGLLWVLGVALPNAAVAGFGLLLSFPLIVWMSWRLVAAASRRVWRHRGAARVEIGSGGDGALDGFAPAPIDEYRPASGSVAVYPRGKGLCWFLFLASSLFVAVILATSGDLLNGPHAVGWIGWLVGLGFASVGLVFFGAGAILGLVWLVHQKPLLRVDGNGLACARGHVRWGDVDRVLEVARPPVDGWSAPSFLVVPREGAAVIPTGRYFSGNPVLKQPAPGTRGIRSWIFYALHGWAARHGQLIDPSLGLEVDTFFCHGRALKAIRRFYPAPIGTVRPEDLARASERPMLYGGTP